jgi:hypothetical protein
MVAIGNGVLRESLFSGALSELHAHQLSTLTCVIATGTAVFFLSQWQRPSSGSEALFIGVLWLLLTVVFEFSFGHFVVGHSWQRLLLDYHLFAGRVWLLFLMWLLLLPYFAFKLHSAT